MRFSRLHVCFLYRRLYLFLVHRRSSAPHGSLLPRVDVCSSPTYGAAASFLSFINSWMLLPALLSSFTVFTSSSTGVCLLQNLILIHLSTLHTLHRCVLDDQASNIDIQSIRLLLVFVPNRQQNHLKIQPVLAPRPGRACAAPEKRRAESNGPFARVQRLNFRAR